MIGDDGMQLQGLRIDDIARLIDPAGVLISTDPMDSAGDLDRISALPDCLLHLTLALVGDAAAVTRTAVLSRRWRRMWIDAPHLSLCDTTLKRPGAGPAGGFEGFVDWVLAQRGYDADMESLDIGVCQVDSCASPQRINGWLRYAMRHVVRSFSLSLKRARPARRGAPAGPTVLLLPGHGRMESLSLYLSEYGVRLRLPAVPDAAGYEALTELRLLGVSFDEAAAAPGGGRTTLGDFVSSCCPRLRKLHVFSPRGLPPQLVIRSDTLQELSLSFAEDLRVLDVTAPSMRVLKLRRCFDVSDQVTKNVARIVAPRLEEISMQNYPGRRRPELDILHGMASVRRITNLFLDMHGPYCCDWDGGLWLLENCTGVEHIDVELDHKGGCTHTDRHLVDLTSEGAAPFANVRSMVVRAQNFSESRLVSSISSLLSRCPHLRYLRIDTTQKYQRHWLCECFCDKIDTWMFHRKFSLGSLEEVTILGFLGADEDMELLALLFEGAKSIRSLTLHAITRFPGHVSLERMVAEEDESDAGSIAQKLMNIPYTDRGYWHFGKDATWTCYGTEKANSA